MKEYYTSEQNNNEDKWYESLWGLIIVTVGLNIVSNWIYDKGREGIRLRDKNIKRKRERSHLQKYHNRTYQQAKEEEAKSNKILEYENAK